MQRTQNFDTDPNWGALNNTSSPLNFGFRNTSHITGATAGEAGGTFTRTNLVNYYADTNLTENLRETFKLQASGKLTADAFNGFDGAVLLGYFDRSGTSSVGLGINEPSPSPSPFRVGLFITLGNGVTRSAFPVATVVTGKDYDWSFTYDPAGAGGNGEITAMLTGIDVVSSQSFSLALNPGDKVGPGFLLNSFGLRSALAGGTSGTADFFVDNLTYTIPEPSCLALLALGGFMIVRRR